MSAQLLVWLVSLASVSLVSYALGVSRGRSQYIGRMSAVRTLHQRRHVRPGHPECCIGCGQRWPCNTERVVR